MSKQKISFQGIYGAYSNCAIEEFSNKHHLNLAPVPCNSFRELFDSINNETHLGMIPIENSNAGSVVQCYDLFLEYDFEIISEFILDINHCLLSQSESFTKVYSHPQALMQCSKYLEDNHLTPITYYDTAGAAKLASTNPNIAAIASSLAAKKYNLDIISSNIQNSKTNQTRFLIVKKKNTNFIFESNFQPKTKSTIIFQGNNIPSALYKCLGGFATNSVNLLKIESRPSKIKNFDYIFYLDFEGKYEDDNVKLALTELEFFSKKVIYLGSYNKAN